MIGIARKRHTESVGAFMDMSNHSVHVKICGITIPQDAIAAAEAGANFIGLNFVSGPRKIDASLADSILRDLPGSCRPIALLDVAFDKTPKALHRIIERYRIRGVQLYGEVTAEALSRWLDDGFEPMVVQYCVADRFPETTDQFLKNMTPYQPAAVVLDAYHPHVRGGSGQTTDWSVIQAARQSGRLKSWPPLILAGGLNPDNVAGAVRRIRPWGVDVSSGVECSVGRKDVNLMRRFVENARNVLPRKEDVDGADRAPEV